MSDPNSADEIRAMRQAVDSPDQVAKRAQIRRQLETRQLHVMSQTPLPKADLRVVAAKSRAYKSLKRSDPDYENEIKIPANSKTSSRFVIQVGQQTALDELGQQLAQHLIPTDSGRAESWQQILESSGVYFEEMFEGAAKQPGAEELAKFFLLIFAIPNESLDCSPFDVAQEMRSQFQFASVRPIVTLAAPAGKNGSVHLAEPNSAHSLADSGNIPPVPVINFDCAWSLREYPGMNVVNAWHLPLPSGGAKSGAGILIGHPDTGWHPHYDVHGGDGSKGQNSEINTALSWNTLDVRLPSDRHNAIDPLYLPPPVFELFRGHGTTGASVAVSRGQVTDFDPKQPGYSGTEIDEAPSNPKDSPIPRTLQTGWGHRVAGVAPEASIVPIRCTNQVIILETVNPAFERAIWYAIKDAKVDIISCSLGVGLSWTPVIGFTLLIPSPSLVAAVDAALAKNIIFVAASSQVINFIPAPANISGVICVSGSTENRQHVCNWGPKVAICAPALHIYEAEFDYSTDTPTPIRKRLVPDIGDGASSFATTQFAGVVALWLAFHGKQNLLKKYPKTPLYRVLLSLLPKSVNTPQHWDTNNWGFGIIDAAKLLSQPLPDSVPPGPLPKEQAIPESPAQRLSRSVPNLAAEEILGRFSAAFGTSAATTETLVDHFNNELVWIFTRHEPALKSISNNTVSLLRDPAERAVDLVQDIHAMIFLYGSRMLQRAAKDGEAVAAELAQAS
jgi:subtilase family protein